MKNLKPSKRFMYYSGVLCATGMEVEVDDLTHISDLLKAEEQGLILKLPCKVGDKLYDVRQGNIQHRINNMVHELEVCCISVKFVPWETWCASDVSLDEIGKTVFLTKAEAEKALAEMGCE